MKRHHEYTPGFLFVFVVAVWALSAAILMTVSPHWETRGQIGDMFGAVNALFSGLALAGVVYAIFLQQQELEHMRASRAAAVVVDLQFGSYAVYFVVSNLGSVEATDIMLVVEDNLPWSGEGLANLEVVKTGISYLPPGRTLKFWLGIPTWEKLTPENSTLKISLRYRSAGEITIRDFVIDFAQFKGISIEADDTSRIVEAIRDIGRHDRLRDDIGRMFRTKPKMKSCIECAESIKEAARKCHYCGSLQTNGSSQDAPA